jgi:hypothetical protein
MSTKLVGPKITGMLMLPEAAQTLLEGGPLLTELPQ